MIRGRVLLFSLFGMGAAAAVLAITQMWWAPMGETFFFKALGTLVLLGTLISFLVAVDYDLPNTNAKRLLFTAVGLSVALVVIVLLKLWFDVFSVATFGKLVATNVILLVLVSFILAVKEDFGTQKKLKDDKYVN